MFAALNVTLTLLTLSCAHTNEMCMLEMDTLKKATGKDNNVHLTDCIYVTQGEKIRL